MVKIRKALFFKVFGLIFEAHRKGEGIFAHRTAQTAGPQNIFRPKRVREGDTDHLYWLTLVALSDRRTNSTVLYRNFAKMFDRNPSLFRRGEYPSLERMTELFRAYKIALPVMEIAFFIERKRHLDEIFGGDPAKIYAGVGDIVGLMRKLKAIGKERGIRNLFPGAKEKIFCLLAMFLREFIDLDFADVVPIDVWVQAIAASTQILVGKGLVRSSPLERLLRLPMTEVFGRYRAVEGAANATWILGKFGCTHCSRMDMRDLCPVFRLCRGPFKRGRHPVSNKHFGAILLPPNYRPKFPSG